MKKDVKITNLYAALVKGTPYCDQNIFCSLEIYTCYNMINADYHNALSDLNEAIKLNPTAYRLHTMKADILSVIGRLDDALTAAKCGVKLLEHRVTHHNHSYFPNDSYCFSILADIHLKKGSFITAEEYAETARKINPVDQCAHRVLKVIHSFKQVTASVNALSAISLPSYHNLDDYLLNSSHKGNYLPVSINNFQLFDSAAYFNPTPLPELFPSALQPQSVLSIPTIAQTIEDRPWLCGVPRKSSNKYFESDAYPVFKTPIVDPARFGDNHNVSDKQHLTLKASIAYLLSPSSSTEKKDAPYPNSFCSQPSSKTANTESTFQPRAKAVPTTKTPRRRNPPRKCRSPLNQHSFFKSSQGIKKTFQTRKKQSHLTWHNFR